MTATHPQASMSARDRLVHTAYEMFSQRGFEAVSLSDIASEVGLTKQAIIYHFKNKKALYAEVLSALAERYGAIIDDVRLYEGSAEQRWQYLFSRFLAHGDDWPLDAGLIARELLDNRERASRSKRWYLRDFLNDCVALYSATTQGAEQDLANQRVTVYREIGAITYLAISDVTLGAIWGERAIMDMQRVQRERLAQS